MRSDPALFGYDSAVFFHGRDNVRIGGHANQNITLVHLAHVFGAENNFNDALGITGLRGLALQLFEFFIDFGIHRAEEFPLHRPDIDLFKSFFRIKNTMFQSLAQKLTIQFIVNQCGFDFILQHELQLVSANIQPRGYFHQQSFVQQMHIQQLRMPPDQFGQGEVLRSRYQLQFMLQDEVKAALINNKLDRELLRQRLKHCVFYTEKGFEKIYVGSMERKLLSTVNTKIDKKLKELQGQTAQPGYAKGIVKIIFRAKDMGKMNKGDILVSVATDPDIVPAMKKAGAIVTEQG